MAPSRPTPDPEQLLEKIDRLLDEMRAMDRRCRQELHEDGLGEEDLLALRAMIEDPVRVRHADESGAPQRSRR